MNWTSTAAVMLALGVIVGAFGAHALRSTLEANSTTSVYDKAVLYHFIHALGLLIVSILPRLGALSESGRTWVCSLLLVGIVIFSGSLYALAITGIGTFGAITPIGGVAFIAAWLLLAFFLVRS